MIGIIVALKDETNRFNKKTNAIQVVNNAILIFSGVGKANAAWATQKIIDKYRVNKIFNIGSCGAISKKISVGDIVIAKELSYYDVDITGFGYKINQLPHEPEEYQVDYRDILKLLKTNKGIDNKLIIGKIATGESFVTTKNIRKFNFVKNTLAIDMESTAIAQICKKNNVSLSVLKIVSDRVKMNDNEKEWTNNMKQIRNIIDELILFVSN